VSGWSGDDSCNIYDVFVMFTIPWVHDSVAIILAAFRN
jgi:hypothetical protein